MTEEIKDLIREQPLDKLANAIGHYVRWDNLTRHEKIMLNMQFGMDDAWGVQAKKMIEFVREVYEEKLKDFNVDCE